MGASYSVCLPGHYPIITEIVHPDVLLLFGCSMFLHSTNLSSPKSTFRGVDGCFFEGLDALLIGYHIFF